MKLEPATADLTFDVGLSGDAVLLQAILQSHPDIERIDSYHDEGGEDWPAANHFYVWLTKEARERLADPAALLAAVGGRHE